MGPSDDETRSVPKEASAGSRCKISTTRVRAGTVCLFAHMPDADRGQCPAGSYPANLRPTETDVGYLGDQRGQEGASFEVGTPRLHVAEHFGPIGSMSLK